MTVMAEFIREIKSWCSICQLKKTRRKVNEHTNVDSRTICGFNMTTWIFPNIPSTVIKSAYTLRQCHKEL